MENTTSKTYTVAVKHLPASVVELSITIPATLFDETRREALKHIGTDVELPGFRKGHVPEKILITKVGEGALLEEMAEIAIGRAYPIIVREEKLDVLGRPEVRITKIAPGNPLECTITSAIFPEIKLPDYKKLAAKEAKETVEITVTDEELEKTINEVRRMRIQKEESRTDDDSKKDSEVKEAELLPLDDAFVKTLGNFANVEEFTTKLRENLHKEKTRAAKDKKRVAIMEAIVNASEIELPEIILGQELARMEDEFAHEIERMGLSLEAYLEAVKKSIEDMRKEWQPDAIKRAKVQLIVAKIAEIETITPDKETLVREAEMLQAQHPDAPKERVASFVTMMLTNEKVFLFLENQGA